MMPESVPRPVPLTSPSGMRAELTSSGALRRFDCDAISLLLFVGNELEGGATNLYLRRHGEPLRVSPLLGPASATRLQSAGERALRGEGMWEGIRYALVLALARDAPVWFWHVRLENTTEEPQTLDLTYAQDLALAPYGAIRLNEYYVSQYLDHAPLVHPTRGWLLASRQNQAADGRNPWTLIGSLRRASAFATDALQLHGRATRAGGPPVGLCGELPSLRLQHEHSMGVLRDELVRLAPGEQVAAGFFGIYQADHPAASSTADLAALDAALALPEAVPSLGRAPGKASTTAASTASASASTTSASAFCPARLLGCRDPDADTLAGWFPGERRQAERDRQGQLLSFFRSADAHVVLRAKELAVLRPHGHLLRTGRHLTPDETGLTSTAWMGGVFHSMLTQGHVSINRLLSTTHSYLSLFRLHGQRVFVEIEGRWHLLDVPSAFEMAPDRCRWLYQHSGGTIELSVQAQAEAHALSLEIEVLAGAPAAFLICHHLAINGDDGNVPGAVRWWRAGEALKVAPAPGSELGTRFPQGTFSIQPRDWTTLTRIGGDELLFADGCSRGEPVLSLLTAPLRSFGLTLGGQLVARPEPAPLYAPEGVELIPHLALEPPSGEPACAELAQLAEIVPWLAHDALIHYLSPRGLEQYSGGGWGTRDVCQGPVELLLATGQLDALRDLLLRVMSTQNGDGDWPQWFMFFGRERGIRAGDSHGDIVFWPVLALAQYLLASGDAGVLEQRVPFFDARGPQAGAVASVWEHVQRARAVIERRIIPGTALAAYGHGDWNDSLQPADPRLRERLCSAWTVTLHHQTWSTLARALRAIGRDTDASAFESAAAAVLHDFQRLLIADGVLAGYALFEDGGQVRHLLHPRDESTGVRYSSLAMVHAILEDMLTSEQIRDHLACIDAHLQGPDGLRLFDRPMPYRGGPQRVFQRAETATFFGREIGLMYMHAHLRYAQALAHLGEAERFFRALRQANPVGLEALVPSATARQANCYYSSSDAAFADRYQAAAEYDRIASGRIALDGGWRVYSSGAGIALGLILRALVGVTREAREIRIDPVMPRSLDGLVVRTELAARACELRYRVSGSGCGVRALTLDGRELSFARDSNPHRLGAARLPYTLLTGGPSDATRVLEIRVGE